MLIGVLCSVVSRVAEDEEEKAFEMRVAAAVLDLANLLDMDHDGFISKSEFESLLKNGELVLELDSLGVDVVSLVDFGRFLLVSGDDFTIKQFLLFVSQFRGHTTASGQDMASLRKYMSLELSVLEGKLQDLHTTHATDIVSMFSSLTGKIDELSPMALPGDLSLAPATADARHA